MVFFSKIASMMLEDDDDEADGVAMAMMMSQFETVILSFSFLFLFLFLCFPFGVFGVFLIGEAKCDWNGNKSTFVWLVRKSYKECFKP